MKNFLKIFLTASLYISSSFVATAQKVDFSGKWKRNDDQTQMAERISINSVPTTLDISQNMARISIKRTSITGNGDLNTYTELLNFNGSSSETSLSADLIKKATVKWSPDQSTLIEEAIYNDNNGIQFQKITENWNLINGGKTLK